VVCADPPGLSTKLPFSQGVIHERPCENAKPLVRIQSPKAVNNTLNHQKIRKDQIYSQITPPTQAIAATIPILLMTNFAVLTRPTSQHTAMEPRCLSLAIAGLIEVYSQLRATGL